MPCIVLRSTVEAEQLSLLLKKWREQVNAGKPLVVSVEPWEAPQTRKQQRRLRALERHIAEIAWTEQGKKPMAWWHDWFASNFIGEEKDPETGRMRPISTTELSVGEMNDHMQRIEQHVVEVLGLELDIP